MSEFEGNECVVIENEEQLREEEDRRLQADQPSITHWLEDHLSLSSITLKRDGTSSKKPPSYGWIQCELLSALNVFIATTTLVSN